MKNKIKKLIDLLASRFSCKGIEELKQNEIKIRDIINNATDISDQDKNELLNALNKQNELSERINNLYNTI